ncbi:hypothetical protein BDW71DRAFT_208253 [Aspergillus fruticulosus]
MAGLSPEVRDTIQRTGTTDPIAGEWVKDECRVRGHRCTVISHAVDPKDQQTGLWMHLGPTDYEIDSYTNGIRLCANRYEDYNDLSDPWLAFLPTDLEFSINYEIRDRERRRTEIEREQSSSGKARVLRSLLVDCIFLYPSCSSWVNTVKCTRTGARLWHGFPLACLRRAFVLMGISLLRADVVGDKIRKQLKQLRDLGLLKDDRILRLRSHRMWDKQDEYRMRLLEGTLADHHDSYTAAGDGAHPLRPYTKALSNGVGHDVPEPNIVRKRLLPEDHSEVATESASPRKNQYRIIGRS